MQIHRDLSQLPTFKNAVVTIGSFDGVHLGHQKIIRQLTEKAKEIGGESVLITFYPHPKQVLFPSTKNLQLITTLEEKIVLIEQQQVDHLIVVPFTKAFSEMSAQDYIQTFLVERTHPHTIIIGYDHHFGHHRSGNIHLLREQGNYFGYKVEEIPEQVTHDLTISSTKIRKYLQEGKINWVNELLGYPYAILGKVVHGDKRGREIGFPTANLTSENEHKLIPADGIYSGRARIPSISSEFFFEGAINIGHSPTFEGKEKRVEIYLFDFEKNIYGEKMSVQFHSFIRKDKKFASAEALVRQMKKDVEHIREVLRNEP